MESKGDVKGARFVAAQSGPQVTLFHFLGLVGAFAGAFVGGEAAIRHGGLLFFVGYVVTGLLVGCYIGFYLLFPVFGILWICERLSSFVLSGLRVFGRGNHKEAETEHSVSASLPR